MYEKRMTCDFCGTYFTSSDCCSKCYTELKINYLKETELRSKLEKELAGARFTLESGTRSFEVVGIAIVESEFGEHTETFVKSLTHSLSELPAEGKVVAVTRGYFCKKGSCAWCDVLQTEVKNNCIA